MMRDPIDTIKGCVKAYNRHDAAGFASFFAEDGSLRVVATGEFNDGRQQVRAGADRRWQVLDYTLDTRGLYACGDDAWLEWTMHGTHIGELMGIPATNRSVEMLGCSHFTLNADGLIATDLVYFDLATMLRQLGLLPELEAAPTT
jgi:steroid delta-isomerase-like uncharacterized protein